MNKELEGVYKPLILKYESAVAKTERLSKVISLLRLIVFTIGVILIYYFIQRENGVAIAISLLISVVIFLVLIRIHSRILARKKLEKAYLKLNRDELKAAEGEFSIFRNGNEFNDPGHKFVNDLDIFGQGSLFQYLNRTCTEAGYKLLGTRLSNPLKSVEEIRSIQKSVDELSGDLDWRQKFQATGMAYQEGVADREKIENWSESKPVFLNILFRILIILVPLLTFFMIGLAMAGETSLRMLLLYLFVPWGISGMFAMKVTHRHNAVSRTSKMLVKYARLLIQIEDFDPETPKLAKLKRKVYSDQLSAGKTIKILSSILTALDNRLNFVSWALLNGLFLWDILQMVRLETWQKKHKNEVKNWFSVVSEFDVMISFANFHFNQEKNIFPVINEDKFVIKAREAGHPLIHYDNRVDNDIQIDSGEFLIVTGANMAGKSTYLRMIGVNLVLAMNGAPVCAEYFEFKPVQLFTSIRTSDSLYENESYFYAELKRLKAIIDELRNGKELFILLDEILKGTNSRDKHAGSEALLKQMISFGTTGVVATHDVLLGKMIEIFPKNIRNFCFEVEINGDELTFDYRLREGISKNLNATILMREMGITI